VHRGTSGLDRYVVDRGEDSLRKVSTFFP